MSTPDLPQPDRPARRRRAPWVVAALALAVICAAGWGTWRAGVGIARPATRPVVDRIPGTAIDIELVQLPAGTVTLRDEAGHETVHALKPFAIMKYEVRWDEWDVMFLMLSPYPTEVDERGNAKPLADPRAAARAQRDAVLAPTPMPYMPPDKGWGHTGSPVQGVTLRTAQRFATWLSVKTGHKYRLPTEAEWVYACRAGGGAIGPRSPDRLGEVAWFAENAEEQTHPCGLKRPNAWGLYDMLGNVAEFVIRDPADVNGLAAGGSYQDDAEDVHDGARAPFSPKWQLYDPALPKSTVWLSNGGHIGFRLVRDSV